VANPAMIAFYQHSPRWRCLGRNTTMQCSSKSKSMRRRYVDPRAYATARFAYIPEGH
jgi:hypothetical protein